jgi:hypothetical protein
VRNLLILTVLVLAAWTGKAQAQSKEDLLSGEPLNPEVVIQALQQPAISSALAQCGAGKLTSGTVTMTVSVNTAGKAVLTKTEPALPPDISGCLGGVIAAMKLPASGGGAEVAFMFTFPATPPPTMVGKPPPPTYPPEYYSGRRMRRAGIGLAIPGAIIFGLGALVLSVSFSIEDTDPALRAGVGMLIFGGALLIPGIILAVAGKKRAEAAMRQALLPMPGLAFDPELRSAHLTLAWRF